MSDNWKEVPFEILPNDLLCLIMPAEADLEQEPLIFAPRVNILTEFKFADTEIGRALKAFSLRHEAPPG